MLLGGLYPLQFDLIDDLEPIIADRQRTAADRRQEERCRPNDLKELIAWLKANPGKASVGIPAVGGTGHLAGLSFQKAIGSQLPVRARIAATARRCRIWSRARSICQIEPASNFYAQVKAGTIKPYAVTSKTR